MILEKFHCDVIYRAAQMRLLGYIVSGIVLLLNELLTRQNWDKNVELKNVQKGQNAPVVTVTILVSFII